MPNEAQALQAFDFARKLDTPEDRRRAYDVIRRYERETTAAGQPLYPEYRQRQNEAERQLHNYFQSEDFGLEPDKLREFNENNRHDPDNRQRYFNDLYLARQFQKQPKEITKEDRDRFTKQRFGTVDLGEKELFQAIREDLDFGDALGKGGQTSGMLGGNSVEGFDKWRLENPELAGLNPQRLEEYRKEFERTHQNTAARLAPYRGTVNAIVQELRIKTGVEEGLSEVDPWSDLAQQLVAIPEKDRGLVLSAIGAVGGDSEEQRKAFLQKMGENFNRGARDLVKGHVGSLSRFSLGQARARLGGPVPAGTEDILGYHLEREAMIQAGTSGEGAFAEAATNIGREFVDPTPEQIETAEAQIERLLDAQEIDHALRQIADQEIDPAEGEWLVTNGLYQASRSIPYTLTALAPGGIVVNSLALGDESYHRLRAEGVPRDQATAIAGISGPLQGLTEQISASILVGKLPGLNRFSTLR